MSIKDAFVTSASTQQSWSAINWRRVVCFLVATAGVLGIIPAPARADLVAYWDFEGNATVALQDKSGSASAHDLTPVGNAAVGMDTGRTALILDGTGDWVTTPGGSGTDFEMGTSSFTIAGWLLADNNTRSGLFDHANSDNDGYYLDMRDTSAYDARIWLDDGNDGANRELQVPNGSSFYSTTVWQHVAVVVDRENGISKLYLNGAEAGGSLGSNDISSLGSLDVGAGAVFALGNDVSLTGRDLDGSLDDWAVWKGDALPSYAIAGLADGTYTPLTAPTGPLQLTIDRGTGSLSLENSTGLTIDKLIGYSITSPGETLDQTGWTPITGHYDDAGDGSVDDQNWTILTGTGVYTDLSEAVFTGDGGTIADEQTVDLGTAWAKGLVEDIAMEIIVDDNGTGVIVPIDVVFSGGPTGSPYVFGDLNFDGNISALDFTDVFVPAYKTDTSSMSLAQKYQAGDLNGDGITNIRDFTLLNEAYLATLPAGAEGFSFSAVPEPGTFILIALTGLGFLGFRVPRHGLPVLVLLASVVCLSPVANADLVAYWDFEGNSTVALQDKSGNGHDFTAVGDATTGSDTGRTALLLDGDGDWVTTPGGSGTDFEMDTVSFTISGWVRTNDTVRSGLYDHANNEGTGYYWDTRISSGGGYDSRIWLDDNTSAPERQLNIPYQSGFFDGNWHHVAVVYDRTNKVAKLYLDGSQEDEENITVIGSVDTGVGTLFALGNDLDQTNRDINAGLDDWAVWRGNVLGPSTIAKLADETFTPLNVPLVLDDLNIQINQSTGAIRLFNAFGVDVSIDAYTLSSVTSDAFLADSLTGGLDASDFNGSGTWTELEDSTTAKEEASFGTSSTIADGTSMILGIAYNTTTLAEDLVFEYHVAGQPAETFVSADVFYTELGDMDLDGDVDNDDVPLFVQALVNRAAYESAVPGADADFLGDFDGNGILDTGDIADFSTKVASATSSSTAVPEPASALLLTLAACCFLNRRFCRRSLPR